MEIHCQYTQEDWLALARYAVTHVKAYKQVSRAWLIAQQVIVLLLSVFVGVIVAWPGSLKSVLAFLFLFELLWWVFFAKFAPAQRYAEQLAKQFADRATKTHSSEETTVRCVVDEEGVAFDSDSVKHFWKWQRIEQVGVTPEYLFLFWDYVLVFPKRAFPSEEAFHAFQETVEKYVAAAHEESEAPTDVVHAGKPAKTPLRKMIELFVTLLLVVGVVSLWCAGGTGVFWKTSTAKSQEALTVLDRFMQAMAAKDVNTAARLWAGSDSGDSRAFVQSQLNSPDYMLYAGYQGLLMNNWSASTDVAQWDIALSGTMHYKSGGTAMFQAKLTRKQKQWEIVDLTIYVSATQIEWYLETYEEK